MYIPSDLANVPELGSLLLRSPGCAALRLLLRLRHCARRAVFLVVIQLDGWSSKTPKAVSYFQTMWWCKSSNCRAIEKVVVMLEGARESVAGSFVDFASQTGKVQTFRRTLPLSLLAQTRLDELHLKPARDLTACSITSRPARWTEDSCSSRRSTSARSY